MACAHLFNRKQFVLTGREDKMQITSTGIVNGMIGDEYGKFGAHFLDDMPTYSLPFEIEGAPAETVSFAVVLDDKDAIPVAGFDWIHWLVANLTKTCMAENESVKINADFIQGNNSWNVPLYGGMAPPDKPHAYDLTVYALDTLLPLKTGFLYDELMQVMTGHILAEAQIRGIYNNA